MVSVSDLITDQDILALDAGLIETFGAAKAADLMTAKRRLAYQWVTQRIGAQGQNARLWNVRRAPDTLVSRTNGTDTDLTSTLGAAGGSADLATVLATPTTDRLFIGLRWPFKGLAVSLLGSLNAQTLATASLTYWNGSTWAPLPELQDLTRAIPTISFSRGGLLHWALPDDWQPRPVVSSVTASSWLYLVQLAVTTPVTAGTVVTDLLPVRRSAFTDAAAYRSLYLIYLTNALGSRQNWAEQAERFKAAADDALTVALPLLPEEMDVDDDRRVAPVEVSSTPPAPGFDVHSWERG